tara:strand:+ start:78 stop:212 length:135 start_codon:yes stop_codon:yes gene_type:complete
MLIAGLTEFLGTFWFILLLCGISFCAGAALKERVANFFNKLKGD